MAKTTPSTHKSDPETSIEGVVAASMKYWKWFFIPFFISVAGMFLLVIISIVGALMSHVSPDSRKAEAQVAMGGPTSFVPDCADQKDVSFENGETVKKIHLAPCKSGWITTPPGTKWFGDSVPANLKYTLCYLDGDCIYYDENKWSGVKRGVFRAIGDGEGELVVMVEYPGGVKPEPDKGKEAQNTETAEGAKATSTKADDETGKSLEGTVTEIIQLEGLLTMDTPKGEVTLRPHNALVYGKGEYSFNTWWILRQGDRVKVVLNQDGSVNRIKYLG